MTLRLRNLGSGSSGNATLIEARSGTSCTRLLIDCGLRVSELKKRLNACDLAVEDLDGVFVTHEHSDHWGHALALCLQAGLPLWSSVGTRHAVIDSGVDVSGLDWRVARDPVANRPIIHMGIVGKSLVVLSVGYDFLMGNTNWPFALLVSGDAVFAALFAAYLGSRPMRAPRGNGISLGI